MNKYWTAAVAAGAASLAILAATLFVFRDNNPPEKKKKKKPQRINVLVASSSPVKKDAAFRALQHKYENVRVTSHGFPSGVNDQPVGLCSTLLGAKNRMKGALEYLKNTKTDPTFDYTVSVENGILISDDDDVVDLAVVLVRDMKTKRTGLATSAGIRFETALYEQWKEGGKKGTVGEHVALKYGCSPKDPHTQFTAHEFSRKDLLSHAIRVALSQTQN